MALLELLKERRVVHPTRIIAVEAGHRSMRLTVSGYPWWRDGGRGEDKIIVSFAGIGEGNLAPETILDFEQNEALEIFSVSRIVQNKWAYGGFSHETYCNQPLPEPLQLYAVVEDYLRQLDAPKSARDFLNLPDGMFSRFCSMTRNRSYLVSRAPDGVQDVIAAELGLQRVGYSVVSKEATQTDRLFVQIGSSSFQCDSAVVEL